MTGIFGKLADIFGREKTGSNDNVQKSERPSDWRFTVKDLFDQMEAGNRKSVGQPELDWAREYERTLIPAHYKFPEKGDLYESVEDQQIEFLTAWAAPFTGSGTGTILKGEQIWIETDPVGSEPVSTYALPVCYNELERRMVPESDRSSVKYGGFYFHLTTMELNEKFRLVQKRFKGKE